MEKSYQISMQHGKFYIISMQNIDKTYQKLPANF